MKKILYVISVVLFTMNAIAQELTVRNVSVKKSGDMVNIGFDINTGKFPQNYKTTLVPVVYHHNGSTGALVPITIVGKKKNISDKRTGQANEAGRMVAGRKETIRYLTSFPFEGWMQGISISIYQFTEGCNCLGEYSPEMVADGKLLYYKITPFFNPTKLAYELTELEQYDLENPFLHAMEDYPRRYDILLKDRDKGTSKVVFKVGSSVIDPGYWGNKRVLDAIAKAFDIINNDPNAVLKHIMIAGYASPEGSLSLNTRLGKSRAEAIKAFIQSRMKSPMSHIFELYNGREDWGGLREVVDNSGMEGAAGILEIIDSYIMEQEIRKTRLKEFRGGAPYRHMLDNFYPALRTGGYIQVYYEIDRRATVSAAVTDSLGRIVWVDPDSPRNRCVTAINNATSLMINHNFDEALEHILEFNDDPRTWNHIGVCYMMKDNYNEARGYFVQAVENGDLYASKNLEEIRRAQQVEQ